METVEQAILRKQPVHLPIVEHDSQDELARRRSQRANAQPEVQTMQFVNLFIGGRQPFVVWADLVSGSDLTWVHIQVDGEVISFDVNDHS